MPPTDQLLTLHSRGDRVRELQESLRRLGYHLPENEADVFYGTVTRRHVIDLQARHGLPQSGMLDNVTRAALATAVEVAQSGRPQIGGRVRFDHGLPADDLRLRLYSRGVGEEATLLGEATTDQEGFFAITYEAEGSVNLEVRAVQDGDEELSLSQIRYNAAHSERMNLVAPAEELRPLGSEYERLTSDLDRELGQLGGLDAAAEDADRQDLTLLNQRTGWDARLSALAVNAARATEPTGLTRKALYGLYRVGLPIDLDRLGGVPAEEVREALGRAVETGVVGMSEEERHEAVRAFERFSVRAARDSTVPGTNTPLRDFIRSSGLTDQQQADLERLLPEVNRLEGEELWTKVDEAGLPSSRLRIQGKLGYLTLNNAELATSLMTEIGEASPLSVLVEKGLYKKDTWERLLGQLADEDAGRLDSLTPPAFEGEDIPARVEAYAEDLARKVRLSYPTETIRQMLLEGELSLGTDHPRLGTNVARLLGNAKPRGFELGRVPIEVFVEKHGATLFDGIPDEERVDAREGLKRLHRLYQLTPSDESLKALLGLGFSSSHDVVAFDLEEFLKRVAEVFPSREEARLVYRRAQQIAAVTYNFFGASQQLQRAPQLFATSPDRATRDSVRENLAKHFPKLESLFGSLDFCDCEHCQSVLSPAAYLVDLLQLLNAEDLVWEHFLDSWRKRHQGEEYTGRYLKPFEALVERRPDLPHLQLTCENTHTALPYIDIVNEILEYFVARGRLDERAVRDIDGADSADLLAEPQHLLHEAYEAIAETRYPLGLPFDLWLETVRGFSSYFETPWAEVLDVLRRSEDLQPADPGTGEPGRADIHAEALGIGARERTLLTSRQVHAQWFTLYGYDTGTEARAALASARTLARRLGVSYRELRDLVRTSFVNPHLATLVALGKLGLETEDVVRYKRGEASRKESRAFEARLDDFRDRYPGFDVRAWLDTTWENDGFQRVLLLVSPDTGCNFGATVLRCARGGEAEPLDFLRLNLFVRLWRRLGWSIDDIDRALVALIPGDVASLSLASVGDAFASALVHIAHLVHLERTLEVGQDARRKLVTLWSDLATSGPRPLYAELFLNAPDRDPVFDDPQGLYLGRGEELGPYLLKLQAALEMTAEEIERVLNADGRSALGAEGLDPARLDRATVSGLYRHGLLARGLRVSVAELLSLIEWSGLDPFVEVPAVPVETTEEDVILHNTLRFVELAHLVRGSGFQVADLERLLRHRSRAEDGPSERRDGQLRLLRRVAAEIRVLRSEHGSLPGGRLTDDALRQKLGLIKPPDVAETLLAMWSGTHETQVSEPAPPAERLAPEDFGSAPDVEVSYDEVSQEQRLTYRGVLQGDRRDRLQAQYGGVLFSKLLDRVMEGISEFHESHFAGFLSREKFDRLFAPIEEGASEAERQAETESRRELLAGALLPHLQKQLERRYLLQEMAAELGTEPALVEALLTDVALLHDAGAPDEELLTSIAAGGEEGLTARFFESADLSGNPTRTETVGGVDLRPRGDRPHSPGSAPPGTASASFEGYLEVATSGLYRLTVVAEGQGTAVELRLGDAERPVLQALAESDRFEVGAGASLEAGSLHRVSFEVRNLTEGKGVTLAVQSAELPRGPLSRLRLHPLDSVRRFEAGHVAVSKATEWATGLGLNVRELRHFASNSEVFGGFDLNLLPTREAEDSSRRARVLFAVFGRLASYVALKKELGLDGDELIGLFERTTRRHEDPNQREEKRKELVRDLSRHLARILRRDADVIAALAEHLGLVDEPRLEGGRLLLDAPGFASEVGLWRLWGAMGLVESWGISAASMIGLAMRAPDQEVARRMRDALRARFDPDSWRRVAQAVNDPLRQRRRDALVAHVMHTRGFERLEELLEFFLIDPGMEPVVQTSRLRLAISSAQLFIQRCLMNLEPRVHPSAVNSRHWEWMKRYRVWEANRKIFLFPENWLEPEFRDDKSHLFQELEGQLLEGDVSADLAEDAFYTYLRNLESLARLEIVSIYCAEEPLDPASNVLHVLGRTPTRPHEYYYRRHAHRMWSPWEPVPVDIEGDHVVVVVWRKRVHVFWVDFLTQNATDESPNTTDTRPAGELPLHEVNRALLRRPQRRIELQLNWSDRYEGKWSERETSGFAAPRELLVDQDFEATSVFIHATKEIREDGGEGAVLIHLGGAVQRAYRVASRNSPPRFVDRQEPVTLPYSKSGHSSGMHSGRGPLTVTFVEKTEKAAGEEETFTRAVKPILSNPGSYSLVTCNDPFSLFSKEIGALVRPLFFQDDVHTFFVEPTLTEKTIEEWDRWVIAPEPPPPRRRGGGLPRIPVTPRVPIRDPFPRDPQVPRIPRIPPGLGPIPPDPIDPYARYKPRVDEDWLTDPGTLLKFGDRYITETGGLDLVSSGGLGLEETTRAYPVTAGSEVVGEEVVIRQPGGQLSGLEQPSWRGGGLPLGARAGLTVISGGGLDETLLDSIRTNFEIGRGRTTGGFNVR